VFNDWEDSWMPRDIAGKPVLCLASGGGQQSAHFGLLGAKVTVLDLCEGQLNGDRQAARHYGYEVTTVQGDMRDLSIFDDESFDLVIQGTSIVFVPDVRPVYREVYRVLRPGGLYEVAHENPATFPASFDGTANGWDGVGYRIAEPYIGGPVRRRADGSENMLEGEPTGEFRHLLDDIFNGLIEQGFAIKGVHEEACDPAALAQAEPGSEAHRNQIIPGGFDILAQKPTAKVWKEKGT
jgi:ubiquinone/menaquinone biosynthesis C-methylase UbiE